MNLFRDCNFQQALDAVTAGTSTQTTEAVDLQGFDGCLWLVSLGTVTAGSVLNAQVNASDVSGSGYSQVGTNATGLTDSGGASSNSVIVVDYYKPLHRYTELVFSRGTANAVINCILAIPYKAKGKQTAAWAYHADVIVSGLVIGS